MSKRRRLKRSYKRAFAGASRYLRRYHFRQRRRWHS